MGVLELALSTYLLRTDNLFSYTESLSNTIFELNGISRVARQADFIFRDMIFYRLAFYINKIKSALSIL